VETLINLMASDNSADHPKTLTTKRRIISLLEYFEVRFWQIVLKKFFFADDGKF
jgi:hypothetical protein